MKSFPRKLLPLATTFFAIGAVLSGCGGGGGSSDSSPSPSTFTNVTLDGTAAKGIIKDGNVIAEELNTDGSVLAQVGSAVTGADGRYTLMLGANYIGGPIQVTISTDANTQMKCDVPSGCGVRTDGVADTTNPTTIDFGEWYKPGSLTMSALVAEAVSNDTISVSITPYTNLAASRAMAAGSLTAVEIYSANSEVSNLLGGIDILNTRPLDITSVTAISGGNRTEIAYAAFGAAIAALADTSGGNPDIDGALDTLSSSFAGGMIIADDGGMDDTVISLQEIIDGATGALGKTGRTDTSGTFIALQTDVDDAVNNTVDPTPSDTTGGTALAKVKAFVSDVRTWSTVIEAETSTKGDAFGMQVDMASSAANLGMKFLGNPAFNAAIEAIAMKLQGNASTNLSSYALKFTAGSISQSGNVITITNGVFSKYSEAGLDVTVNMSVQKPANGTMGTSFTIGINSATFRSDYADADITSGTVTVNLASPYTVDYAALDMGTAGVPEILGGSLNLNVSLIQKQDRFGVALASQVTFAGVLSTTLTNPAKDSFGDIRWITPSSLTLGGNISDTVGNSLDASFTVNISNAGSFTPVGGLPMGTIKTDIVTWTYTDVSPTDGTDDTFTLVSPGYTMMIQWNSVTGAASYTQSWSDGYSGGGSLSGLFTDVDTAVAAPTSPLNWSLPYYQWVDGEGGYSVNYTGTSFSANGSADGSLVYSEFVLENSSNWLKGTAGLNFTLQLAELPEASVNISGDRTEFKAGTATITIAYGTRQIVINSTFTPMSSTGSVTITNQDGVTMNLEGGDFETGMDSNIVYNGNTYATVEQMANGLTKITYIDGNFEIL